MRTKDGMKETMPREGAETNSSTKSRQRPRSPQPRSGAAPRRPVILAQVPEAGIVRERGNPFQRAGSNFPPLK